MAISTNRAKSARDTRELPLNSQPLNPLRDAGTDIRTAQDLLGHADVATTQIYTHVMKKPGLGVRSPLDD